MVYTGIGYVFPSGYWIIGLIDLLLINQLLTQRYFAAGFLPIAVKPFLCRKTNTL
jgi:hypothetical protein